MSVILELTKDFSAVLCFLGWLKLPWLKVLAPFPSHEVLINVEPLKIQVMGREVVFSASAEIADKQLLFVLPYPRNKLPKV